MKTLARSPSVCDYDKSETVRMERASCLVIMALLLLSQIQIGCAPMPFTFAVVFLPPEKQG